MAESPHFPERTTVTLIYSRVIAPARMAPFRAWAERLGAAVERHPGFRGALRIEQTGGVFHLVHRFATRADLDSWEASPPCCDLQAEAEAFSTPHHATVAGPLPWVQLPSEADAPKWKRFLMTWLAALPVALAMSYLLDALPVELPIPVQSILTSLVLIATMTWLILPRLSRWLKPWVMRDSKGNASVQG